MAELSHRERVPGARLVWLFRAAPAQRALVSAGRQVPGYGVRWGSLRRLRPFSDPYGYDCVILTQLLQFPFPRDGVGQRLVVARLRWGLMPTVPSLARVDRHDPGTDFWRFTSNGLAELLHRLGMPASVAGYANVLACVAALRGPSVEELSAEELDVAEPRFPLVACAHAEKAR